LLQNFFFLSFISLKLRPVGPETRKVLSKTCHYPKL
jgi:hypothetical protein